MNNAASATASIWSLQLSGIRFSLSILHYPLNAYAYAAL